MVFGECVLAGGTRRQKFLRQESQGRMFWLAATALIGNAARLAEATEGASMRVWQGEATLFDLPLGARAPHR